MTVSVANTTTKSDIQAKCFEIRNMNVGVLFSLKVTHVEIVILVTAHFYLFRVTVSYFEERKRQTFSLVM